MSKFKMAQHPKVTNVDFRDKTFFDELENPDHPNHNHIKMTLLHLSLCHTTLCENKNGELIYNASSPDELALVNYAKFCGYEFLGKDENNILSVRNWRGEVLKFELMQVLEFNSTRYQFCSVIFLFIFFEDIYN